MSIEPKDLNMNQSNHLLWLLAVEQRRPETAKVLRAQFDMPAVIKAAGGGVKKNPKAPHGVEFLKPSSPLWTLDQPEAPDFLRPPEKRFHLTDEGRALAVRIANADVDAGTGGG